MRGSRRDVRRPADRSAGRRVPRGTTRTAALPEGAARGGSRLSSEQAAQLARGAKQVNTHGGFVEAGHDADLSRGAIAVMTEHEDGPLPPVQPIDRAGQPGPSLARE